MLIPCVGDRHTNRQNLSEKCIGGGREEGEWRGKEMKGEGGRNGETERETERQQPASLKKSRKKRVGVGGAFS